MTKFRTSNRGRKAVERVKGRPDPLSCLEVSITAVRERVVRLSAERVRTKKKGQIALTERQMRIVEYINKNGRVAVSNIATMFKISRQAALKEIGKMVEMEIVKREGQARASCYVMR